MDEKNKENDQYLYKGPSYTITMATVDDMGIYSCSSADWGTWGTRRYSLVNVIGELTDKSLLLLIVCAQPFCGGNATVICHASVRLAGSEDKHGVENAGEKNFRPILLLWITDDPYLFNHQSLTQHTIY